MLGKSLLFRSKPISFGSIRLSQLYGTISCKEYIAFRIKEVETVLRRYFNFF